MSREERLVQLIKKVKDCQEKVDASNGAKLRLGEIVEAKENALRDRLHQRLALANGDSALRASALEDYRNAYERLKQEKIMREGLAQCAIERANVNLLHYERELVNYSKSLQGELFVSNGMMAEALSKETGKDWRVVHVEPYQYLRRHNGMEYVYGTYLVSEDSPKYADEMVYSMEDPDYDFPSAIQVHGGRSSKALAQYAQEKYDRINWLDIYLQDLVGGATINPYMAIFKHSEEPEWQIIRDAFENQILAQLESESVGVNVGESQN